MSLVRTAPSPVEVSALVVAGRIDRLLAHARAAASPSTRRWLVDALEHALLLADPGAVSEGQRDEAVALGVSTSIAAVADVKPPPHAVLVPFAPIAGGSGLVRMVHVASRLPYDSDALVLAGASRDAVRQALELAERFAKPGSERGAYRLGATQPDGAAFLRVEGTSLGAAVFVSAVALWSERRVRPGTVITGKLTATGVDAVGHLAAKLDGALEGRADVRRIVVPTRNAASVRAAVASSGPGPEEADRVEVVGVGTLSGLLEAALEPAGGLVRPDDAVAEARQAFERGWQGWRWPAQREPLERLAGELPASRPDLRVAVLTMWGAVTRHLGAPDASLAVLEQALGIVDGGAGDGVPDLPLTELHQHLALTLRQLCRFGEAAEAARRAVRVAKRGRLRGELLEAHGCAGLVELSRGRAAAAVAHQRAALDLVHAHRPSSCPRTHGYLVEALGRAGDLGAARAQWKEGLAHLDRVAEPSREAREAWLRTSFASALAAHDRWRDVGRVLAVGCVAGAIARDPLPGLLARRWLGLSRAASSTPEEGWELLAASPAAHGRALMPHVRFLAHLNVLFEARSRLARDALDTDAAARAETALGQLPRYGEADSYLGRHAAAVRRALGGRADATLARALDRLLDRAQRVA